MLLRKLKTEDAPFMLEWMHDESVVENLQTNFASKTLADCELFIQDSQVDSANLHMAIVDENDEYMGTVSLKNIADGSAEFAITIRKTVMGTGISRLAMKKILEVGFEKEGLHTIYWCVSPDNKRAVRFYDKNGYHRISPDTLNIRGGGTAKTRYRNIFGIKSQETTGWKETKTKYELLLSARNQENDEWRKRA